MCGKLGIPLALDQMRTAPPAVVLASVKSWLEQDDPTCLQHPHGFYVVLLGRSETEEWRFHFWPEGPRTVVGMPALIHTHDCHVESRILQGRLTNTLYDAVTVPTGGYPLYEVGYGGDRYGRTTSNTLRRTTTRVQTVVRDRTTLRYGETYCVERQAYHDAIVPEEISTATLVCMHGRSPGTVFVVGLDGYPDNIEFTRAEFRARTFAERLSP